MTDPQYTGKKARFVPPVNLLAAGYILICNSYGRNYLLIGSVNFMLGLLALYGRQSRFKRKLPVWLGDVTINPLFYDACKDPIVLLYGFGLLFLPKHFTEKLIYWRFRHRICIARFSIFR
jgi:hypothetical protein